MLAAQALDLDFGRPAPGKLRVGSGWGPRESHDGTVHQHAGLDMGLPEGTPIWALADGVVIHADPTDDSAAGKHVAVRHTSGVVSRYLHLSRVDVRAGDTVRRGQTIALSGNTGRSDGPHLHLELRAPAAVLPGIEAAVGKPSTGWGSSMAPYGIAIPAEPWVPVDEVRLTTMLKAAKYGIPLYSQRAGTRTRLAPPSPEIALAGAGLLAATSIFIAAVIRRRRLRR